MSFPALTYFTKRNKQLNYSLIKKIRIVKMHYIIDLKEVLYNKRNYSITKAVHFAWNYVKLKYLKGLFFV